MAEEAAFARSGTVTIAINANAARKLDRIGNDWTDRLIQRITKAPEGKGREDIHCEVSYVNHLS
jgi:hypothetical protein